MKFKKAVFINIADTHFDKKYWDQIDELVESRVSLNSYDVNLIEELKDCDCLMLGFQVPTGKDIIDAAPNLKLINILATAYGTVDLEAATARNIPVCNLAGYSTESVAEFTIAAMLHEMRQIEEGLKRARVGNFDPVGIRARELKGSNFAVIGLGSIGNRVAELAAGFGANVSYWSRSKKNVPFKYLELNELLASNEFISLNISEAPETTDLLNDENITLIKTDSILISTVPPAIISTNALVSRLEKGDITFITDHPNQMPEKDLAKISSLNNVTIYPGIAYISDEARIAKQEIFIENVKTTLIGQPTNRVN